MALMNFVGPNPGTKLKAASGWNNNNGASDNGTDDYGFSALPGGYGGSDDFLGAGFNGRWWSASESQFRGEDAIRRSMNYNSETIGGDNASKAGLYSVRCLQD
jgi:uncharacterized protein (TIGR02145 family)